jgi:glyoxylase-like metal-dependent hydrolase (beta-lactamase superfamily II)
VELERLTDSIYEVTAVWDYEVHSVASVGEDGILLVDTGFKETAGKLAEALESLHAGPVRFIITSHAHVDHTGGNPTFGKDVPIIGQEATRMRMTTGGQVLQEYPEYALPNILLKDEIVLHFNGEDIRIFALPGAHCDSDLGVLFTNSNVAYLGDLAYGNKFPSTSGRIGSAADYAAVVARAIGYLPDGVTIVSGHGRRVSKPELVEFQEMLQQTTELVRRGLAAGKDLATMQEEDLFAPWKDEYGGYYVTANDWMAALVASLQPVEDDRTLMVGPLYQAYQDGGIDALIATFEDLTSHHADEYVFGVWGSYNFSKYLVAKGRFDEAIRFGEVAERVYDGHWLTLFAQAEAYMGKGDTTRAIHLLRRVLEIKPDQLDTVQLLERLEGEQGGP